MASARQRVVLAALLRSANTVVTIDQLADLLWNGRQTSGATSTVYSYVMRLRRTLGSALGARIRTNTGGYLLTVAPEEVDVGLFHQHRAAGKRALDEQRWADAAAEFAGAARLWRGEPYADVPAEALRCDEAERLREQWLTVREWQNEAELRLGRHDEVIARLRGLVAEHPLREPFTEQMMHALSQAGRPAEAVVVYESARHNLIGQIGLGPGPELKSRLDAILGSWSDSDRDWDLVRAPARAPTPAQLPADLPDFTGRESTAAELRALVTAGARRETVTVVTITGAAGTGKTALALRVAHLVRRAFGGGQLFVDLGGSSDRPLGTGEALARFLRAVGVPASAVPEAVDECAALLRSALAGRQVLLLLDDAADADQVRALLPGAGTCAVIVTARSRLTRVPGDHHFALDALHPEESRALFTRLVGRDRVHAEQRDAAAVVAACDGLPLALRLVGARITGHPGRRIATLARRLRDESQRLTELRSGNDGVATRIDASLARLPSGGPVDPGTLFALLGTVAMPDLGPDACGALAGASVQDTEAALDLLVDLHLVELDPVGRYGLRELPRLRATELAWRRPAVVRTQACERLVRWYLRSAEQADRMLAPHGVHSGWPAPSPSDRGAAARWYEQERYCLPYAARAAADGGLDAEDRRLTTLIERHLTAAPTRRFGDYAVA
ncbi:BTAD domain-containing putative transcriptional regulator [Micromonospora sp. M61]|uniref:AfsR/SARP family transcriptional regulator n=1 Tax=Micromonospora sp. M61 TaxID=2824890 RepID=UPI001B38BF02|nr:BTAD domain-containing putative transcriptional regulator [Micromonospora sp. M61]MBQ0977919.1 winged helix-turn-helix domain-containing protein [Micromonospora sp. M61]